MVGIPGRLKGISGGEMKRLAFACEVLTDPPLLFCDEPTSGLDSFMAQNVVGVMKALAEKGKTIVATIHQPSSELYAMFDRLLLMAEGRTAYLGDVDGAFDFFNRHGYACPPNFNPADFFIHTLAIVPGDEENCRKRVFELCDAFETSEDGLAIKDLANRGGVEEGSSKLQSIDDEVVMKTGVYKAGWFAQLNAVVWRSFVSISREPLILKVRLFQTVVFCQELPIFLREHFNGMYRVDVYFLSKM
ncbi:unnamed protein product, partial [Notodromas monacha]